MKKILFVLSDAHEPRNANVNVVMALAKQFRKSFMVYVLASYTEKEKLIENLDEYFDFVIPFCILDVNAGGKFGLKSSHLAISRCIRRTFHKEIVNACKSYNINIIIGATNPYLIPEVVSKSNIKCEKVLIQLDPFTFNYTLPQDYLRRLCRKIRENRCYNKLDKIFICDVQIEEYIYRVLFKKNRRKERLEKKVLAIQLPGILTDNYANEIATDYKMIGLLNMGVSFAFIGRLYKDIRNPVFMLELFSHLPENFHLHIIGGGCEDIIEKYICKMRGRLHLHGWVEKEEANLIMIKCDILVNLNNNINNQLPSKIFEYMNTGKPIINICSNDSCPTIRLLDEYDNSINIIEENGISEEICERIKRFTLNNKEHLESKSKILSTYHKYTDKAVADYMMSKL